MECYVVSTAGKTVFTNGRIKMKNVLRNQGNMAGWSSVVDHQRLTKSNRVLFSKNAKHHVSWRLCCKPVSVEEGSSSTVTETFAKDEESMSEDSPEEAPRPLSSDELKALLADSERSKLIKKLSEANQQNRFLKRQLQTTENSLISFKSELATMDLEIQALVNLAEEIANYNIPDGSRKINGKYIQSHLLSRLQVVQEKMKEQIKDVEAAQPKEVPLFWSGVAESVQIMGSFDGWSEGEHLSPEYTGSYTMFTATLMLRPGRYEIKFLVDGEWQLSPEFPTVGEGLTQNNILIVE
ncbi:protein PTST, chloroplastic isoform X2 [Olea europaea var. sylvestris]|uniref:protein PTST, chloroplastic isoform X2 n=1 Tax=Olea europaea var. sylvestris TaxID=158386 RepID=UPI000C1D698A|nr:protein PTST, chloroplastic isoform X2 [Olea europaea var. sylvestris]XP_022894809.1 protein PTST, chloroplastic isoform X2 [Olea europaea var. sylvestris]